jgi:hypothetical protein
MRGRPPKVSVQATGSNRAVKGVVQKGDEAVIVRNLQENIW